MLKECEPAELVLIQFCRLIDENMNERAFTY